MFPRNSFGIPWKHLTVLTDAFDLKLLHSLSAVYLDRDASKLNAQGLKICYKSGGGEYK